MNPRVFFGIDSYVVLEPEVLQHIYRFVQFLPWKTEAGGELYSRDPLAMNLAVHVATGPHRHDQRTRHGFTADRVALNNVRSELYGKNLHVVGIWHTHPQRSPVSSSCDRTAAIELAKGFEHERKRYLLLTVGNALPRPIISVEYLHLFHDQEAFEKIIEGDTGT